MRIEDSVSLRRWSLKVLTCERNLLFIKADLHIIVMDMRSGLCTYHDVVRVQIDRLGERQPCMTKQNAST